MMTNQERLQSAKSEGYTILMIEVESGPVCRWHWRAPRSIRNGTVTGTLEDLLYTVDLDREGARMNPPRC